MNVKKALLKNDEEMKERIAKIEEEVMDEFLDMFKKVMNEGNESDNEDIGKAG